MNQKLAKTVPTFTVLTFITMITTAMYPKLFPSIGIFLIELEPFAWTVLAIIIMLAVIIKQQIFIKSQLREG